MHSRSRSFYFLLTHTQKIYWNNLGKCMYNIECFTAIWYIQPHLEIPAYPWKLKDSCVPFAMLEKIPFFNFMFLLIFFINRFTCINVTRHKFLNKCSCSRQYFTENFKLHSLDSFAVSQILPWWGSKVYLQSVKETLKTRYWPDMNKIIIHPSSGICSQQNKSK